MFPTPLAILMFCAPESPWWLVRKGRLEQAAKSVERLGRKSQLNSGETVAMMRRVIELEESKKEPSYWEMFKGTDTYRTLIVCGVYASQNLTGNLIANQAVYFFEREWPTLAVFPAEMVPYSFRILANVTAQRPVYLSTLPSPSVSSPRPSR